MRHRVIAWQVARWNLGPLGTIRGCTLELESRGVPLPFASAMLNYAASPREHVSAKTKLHLKTLPVAGDRDLKPNE